MEFFKKTLVYLLVLLICDSVTTKVLYGKMNSTSKYHSWNRENTSFIIENQMKYGTRGKVFYSLCEKAIDNSWRAHCNAYSFSFKQSQHLELCNLANLNLDDVHEIKELWRTSDDKIAFRFKTAGKVYHQLYEINMGVCETTRTGQLYHTEVSENDLATPPQDVVVFDDSTFDLFSYYEAKRIGFGWRSHTEAGSISGRYITDYFPSELDGLRLDSVNRSIFLSGYDSKSKHFDVFRIHKVLQNPAKLSSLDPAWEAVSTSGRRLYVLCRTTSRISTTNVVCLKYDEVSSGPISPPIGVKFAEPVRLLKVLLSENEEILLVAECLNCVGYQCWNLILAENIEDQVKITKHRFLCSGRRDKIVMHYHEGVVIYACENVDVDDEARAYLHVEQFLL